MNNKIYKSTEELAPFISDVISSGKSIRITVTGNSMFPLFTHERDTVEIRKAPVYRKYDIILYMRSSGELVLHRIVKKNKDFYCLCGDNQLVCEYPIYENQIIGKVVGFTRKGKQVSVDNFFNRLYSRFWCFSIKLRKPVLRTALKIWEIIKK